MKMKLLFIAAALVLSLAFAAVVFADDGYTIQPDPLFHQFAPNDDGIDVIIPTSGNAVWFEINYLDWVTVDAYMYGGIYNGWVQGWITIMGPWSPGYLQVSNMWPGDYKLELRQGSTVVATYDFIVANQLPCRHLETYEETVLEPTCEEPGIVHILCLECGAKRGEDTIAALGHEWDGGTVTKEPTLEAEGVRTFTCTRDDCGATQTEAIANTYTAAVTTFTKSLQGGNNGNLKFTVTVTMTETGKIYVFDYAEKINGGQKGSKTFNYGYYSVYAAWNDNNTVTSCSVR